MSMDWAEWSRQAVQQMQARNDAWQARFELGGARYSWDLNRADITFADRVTARICVVGTTSAEEDAFLWSWANDSLPIQATQGIEKVRAFGEEHDLSLLTQPCMRGGRPEALEVMAISGRILDADGCFVDSGIFFTLHDFRPIH